MKRFSFTYIKKNKKRRKKRRKTRKTFFDIKQATTSSFCRKMRRKEM